MTPALTTRELFLVPLTEASASHVALLNDPENVKFSEQRHHAHTIWTCAEYLSTFDRVNDHVWSVRHLSSTYGGNGDHIGSIAVRTDQFNLVADISVMLDHRYHNQGYGTQAWEAVIEWLFQRGVRKIEAGTMAVNTAMISVLVNKLGFFVEGARRGHFLLDGKPVDMVYFGKFNERP